MVIMAFNIFQQGTQDILKKDRSNIIYRCPESLVGPGNLATSVGMKTAANCAKPEGVTLTLL